MDHGVARDPEVLSEFQELAHAAGATVVDLETTARNQPDPRLFVGEGKANALKAHVESEGVELLILNHALSPAQERNLERFLGCRVLDRTGLILDIFSRRARTHEGKLQVELAQLRHLSTRLVRGWTHLERQKGGIGLRGPGESQLETDRRLIGDRIRQLRQRLAKVVKQREQGRRARRRAELPVVALVGYTNAGKSTLFNRLAGADAFAADQLFATLDPTLRRIELGGTSPVLLADTVGFIRDLPHALVAAFRATLEETRSADLIVHVVDAASERRHEAMENVESVLAEIGAEDVPRLEVFNKIDCLDGQEPRVDRDDAGLPQRVWLSAATGAGTEALADVLRERFRGARRQHRLRLPPGAGKLRSWLFDMGTVLAEEVDEEGVCVLDVELDAQALETLRREGADVVVSRLSA